MSRLVALSVLVVAVAALAAAPASARKPTRAAPSQAAVTASPNPASVGTTVYIQGCGYSTSSSAEIRIKLPSGSTRTYGVAVWYTGCLNRTPFATSEVGAHTIQTYQRPSKPRNASPVLKASTVLTVTG